MSILDKIKAEAEKKNNLTETQPEDYIEVSKQQIIDFDCNSWKKGRGWEIPEYPMFNEAMEGLETGMFLVAGESNGGKSAWLLDMILKYSMNEKNKLYGIYFSLDDTADKLIPRILSANAKLDCNEESGVPISVFSKPKRYLDKLNEIREDTDVSREDEARVNYSYLFKDITSGNDTVNFDNVGDSAPSYEEFPDSVRAKTYQWYKDNVVKNFKIVDGTKIHNGEQLFDYCRKIKEYIRAERGLDWNIIVGIDSLSDITWEEESFSTDKEMNDYTSRIIKQWAVEDLECPIFGSIHLRKIDQRKRPTIADVKESGRWVYEANIVFLLHNEVSRSGVLSNICVQDGDTIIPVIEVLWAKNKQSSYKGRTYFMFWTNYSKIKEVEEYHKNSFDGILNGV